jgi:hypothetical protein
LAAGASDGRAEVGRGGDLRLAAGWRESRACGVSASCLRRGRAEAGANGGRARRGGGERRRGRTEVGRGAAAICGWRRDDANRGRARRAGGAIGELFAAEASEGRAGAWLSGAGAVYTPRLM